jgi:CheY-like chemotaxis protein
MKPVVVVVDDEPAIVQVVCDVLMDADVNTVACLYSLEANARIRELRPDVVLLDVQMPIVDGIEIFRAMRADDATRSIPVIFFTANSDKLVQRLPDYHDQGAILLPKPFNVIKLLALVRSALDQRAV